MEWIIEKFIEGEPGSPGNEMESIAISMKGEMANQVICEMAGNTEFYQNAARLIKNAPKLLEACKEAEKVLDLCEWDEHVQFVYHQLIDAIAAAEGKEDDSRMG